MNNRELVNIVIVHVQQFAKIDAGRVPPERASKTS
jgi:hypothetical protein